MSAEDWSEVEVIEIKEWMYPDNIQKMIMNDLIRLGKLSALDYPQLPGMDYFPSFGALKVLEYFLYKGWVTSATIDGVLTYTPNAFFNLRIQQYRDRMALEAADRQRMWDLDHPPPSP